MSARPTSATGALKFNSVDYGTDSFVSVSVVDKASGLTFDTKDSGGKLKHQVRGVGC